MRLPRITRRSFFKTAAAGSVVAAAAVSVLSGCTHSDDESASDPVVVGEDSAEDVISSFTEAELPISEEASWSLPLGNVLHPAEGLWVPVTTAGSSATPMVKGSALSLATGELFEVVSAPVGQGTTVVIYDVRCSDEVYAWVELDLSDRSWVLYAAAFSEGALSGKASTLWEGTSDYDPAPFAVSGGTVIWQVQPSATGSRTAEHSFCYVWHVGDSEAKAVVDSPGRFATSPTLSGDAVVLTPRVRADEGVYYGVTAYSLSDDLTTRRGSTSSSCHRGCAPSAPRGSGSGFLFRLRPATVPAVCSARWAPTSGPRDPGSSGSIASRRSAAAARGIASS